jgi:Na+/H+-dicarboxylate symporter
MKIWIKLLLGSILGAAAVYLLPQDNQNVLAVLAWLENLTLRIGRYALPPVLVFSLTIAVYELRQDGQFWPLVLRSFLFIIGGAVFVIAAGVGATLLFPPGRIRIPMEEQLEAFSLDVAGNVLALFPSNMFQALGGDGAYIFPFCVFAFFLGMGLSYDRSYTRPVIALIDSLSRIFYHIISFFSEILGFIMIILAAYWAFRFRTVQETGAFRDLIVLLGAFSLIFSFVVLPILLCFIRPKLSPWAVLYGSLGPGIAAWFSGDVNFTFPVLLRHGKENFGVRRRANAVSLSLFATFGRGGSAMVAAVAFIVIIKSYSSLGITTLADTISICLRALLISFFLARHPGDGAYTALAVLCLGYGGGYEAGYLILKPLAFYLITVGTFLDVMIASFSSYAIACLSGFQENKSLRHYI